MGWEIVSTFWSASHTDFKDLSSKLWMGGCLHLGRENNLQLSQSLYKNDHYTSAMPFHADVNGKKTEQIHEYM